MDALWLSLIIVTAVIVGNLLILKRTARKPHLPASVKPDPYSNDDERW
jgi:hypothetical protein